MRLVYSLLLLASWCSGALNADTGTVDWHKSLIGVPSVLNTAPVFHRFAPSTKTTQSIVLTATKSNVLAALDPVSGSLVWRHVYDAGDPVVTFNKHGKVVASLSGTGGTTLRAFDALTGDVLVERRVHAADPGRPSAPPTFGAAIAFSEDDGDMFVLSNGHQVSRIDGRTGSPRWTWKAAKRGPVVYSMVVPSSLETYVVGYTPSFAVHVTTLSPGGNIIADASLSTVLDSLSDFLVLRTTSQSRIVWLTHGVIRSCLLMPHLKENPVTLQGPPYKRLLDVGLADEGIFVAVQRDGVSKVLRLDPSARAGLEEIWDFADTSSPTDPVFSGGFDKQGKSYVARIYWVPTLETASIDVFAPHLAEGKGIVHSFTFPFDPRQHGTIEHVALDVANPSGWNVYSRWVVTTSTGAVQSWQQSNLTWTREESLTAIAAAQFVELLPEKLASTGLETEGFVERLGRHVLDARGFPQYVVNFVRRFATGSYESATAVPLPDDPSVRLRDPFGFRQVVVAATKYGKVFGIDSVSGHILWSRLLGPGTITPQKVFASQRVGDIHETPQVIILAQTDVPVDTVLYHLDARSGEDLIKSSPNDGVLEGLDVFDGPLTDAFFQSEHGMAILLDKSLHVHLYPKTPATFQRLTAFNHTAASIHFPLCTDDSDRKLLSGHQIALHPALGDKFATYPTWTRSFASDEKLEAALPSVSRGPIASIGRVLGNRTTLYKYLSPHLFIALTALRQHGLCGIYVLDSVKGSTVHQAVVPLAKDGECDVKATLTENWLVYHYFDPEDRSPGSSKGYKMVSVELYEGAVDRKFHSSDMSSFSSKKYEATPLQQAYIFHHAITAISSTSTKFGVTSKDIIVATANNKIYSIPRQLLDPRRPNRKLTTEEQEENLVQYSPLLYEDPRRVLSHKYQVANIMQILTAPSMLESTSLVFAYGLDLFFTRVTPSGPFDILSPTFNKAQLVFTVSGLALAITITKPMMERKRLRQRWYQ